MDCCCEIEKEPVEILSHLLGNTYVLLVKTQNVHWNARGCGFRNIHLMTEEHYNELFEAVDLIAERIRKIGADAPGTMSKFLKLACLEEEISAKDGCGMLAALLEDHKAMVSGIKKALAALGNSADYGTLDLLTSRLVSHEKIVWMLSAGAEN